MRGYKQEFIELALEVGVLRFGQFKLKSGRNSPYFFNSGLFNTGYAAAKLGRTYAAAVADSKIAFDMLFGPAYKGIPLVALTAAALAEHHGRDLPFCFNRKEIKEHGEGGAIVGAPVSGRVLILDDVITAGTAIRETITLLRQAGRRAGGRRHRPRPAGAGQRGAVGHPGSAADLRHPGGQHHPAGRPGGAPGRQQRSTGSSCPSSRTTGNGTGSRPEGRRPGQVRAWSLFSVK